jgi:hypothetical protein
LVFVGRDYAAALACIVDAQAALPLSRVWGDGTTLSSDGQFFRSGRRRKDRSSKSAPEQTEVAPVFIWPFFYFGAGSD